MCERSVDSVQFDFLMFFLLFPLISSRNSTAMQLRCPFPVPLSPPSSTPFLYTSYLSSSGYSSPLFPFSFDFFASIWLILVCASRIFHKNHEEFNNFRTSFIWDLSMEREPVDLYSFIRPFNSVTLSVFLFLCLCLCLYFLFLARSLYFLLSPFLSIRRFPFIVHSPHMAMLAVVTASSQRSAFWAVLLLLLRFKSSVLLSLFQSIPKYIFTFCPFRY